MSENSVATESGAFVHMECIPESLIETFASSCSMAISVDPDIDVDSVITGSAAVIAVISLTGDVTWSVSVGMPEDVACAAMEGFAGFEIPFESADMGDAAGELVNVLAGELKSRLEGAGAMSNMSLPSVLRGSGMRVLTPHGAPFRIWCFTSSAGKLWVEVVASNDVVPARLPGQEESS